MIANDIVCSLHVNRKSERKHKKIKKDVDKKWSNQLFEGTKLPKEQSESDGKKGYHKKCDRNYQILKMKETRRK
jgi:hypothetical protein